MIEYIKENDLNSGYQNAKQFMAPLFKPFPEFERIARNRPHPGIAKDLPKVTDGTLAATIMKQPKRVIQQLPTGKVRSDDELTDIVAGDILDNDFARADLVAEQIQKFWALTTKSLIYGSQPAFVQFVRRGDSYTTDFSLPYIQDVLLEPGKLSDKDSNVIYLRSWYQPTQIDALIHECQKSKERAEKRGEEYDGHWDPAALKAVRDKVQEKEEESRTPSEREKGGSHSGIELIHVFQRGIGSTFYTFHPGTSTIVRRKKNPDPRGLIPIHYMYADFDFSNPLGRGVVELAGPMQNLLDSEVQAYQYKRILEMDGPVLARGNGIIWSTIKNRPRAVWRTTDPNSTIEPVKYSTASIEGFPTNYGLIKSQILNLTASPDTSIGAEAGNPGFSRTPAGVKAMEANLGIDDNYLLKQFESAFQEIQETRLNLYFAERKGKHAIELSKAAADKVRKLDPNKVNDKNEILMDFDGGETIAKFTVDPTSSSKKDNQQQVEVLSGLLERLEASPILTQLIPKEKVQEAWNAIVAASGVENPERLKIKMEEELDENGQPVQKPQGMTPEDVQAMIEEALAAQQPQDDPLLKIFKELPESAKQQLLGKYGLEVDDVSPRKEELNIKKFQAAEQAAGPSDEELDAQMTAEAPEEEPAEDTSEGDSVLVQEMTSRGYGPEQIAMVMQMLEEGAPEEDIAAALQGGVA